MNDKRTESDFNPVHYGLLLAALLVIGVVFKLVSEPQDEAATQSVEKQ